MISLFVTGEGQTSPAGIDGKTAGSVLPAPARTRLGHHRRNSRHSAVRRRRSRGHRRRNASQRGSSRRPYGHFARGRHRGRSRQSTWRDHRPEVGPQPIRLLPFSAFSAPLREQLFSPDPAERRSRAIHGVLQIPPSLHFAPPNSPWLSLLCVLCASARTALLACSPTTGSAPGSTLPLPSAAHGSGGGTARVARDHVRSLLEARAARGGEFHRT